MKINEQERVGLINLLKEEVDKNSKMLENGDYDWFGNEIRQNVIDYNEQMKRQYELLESKCGEVEMFTNGFDLNSAWVWWLITLNHIYDNKFDIED